MSPPLSRIASDERLPAQADVVVIGGRVIGVSAAYHLARKGHSVALIEKGHVGANSRAAIGAGAASKAARAPKSLWPAKRCGCGTTCRTMPEPMPASGAPVFCF